MQEKNAKTAGSFVEDVPTATPRETNPLKCKYAGEEAKTVGSFEEDM
jgi:hypothetical protein